MSQSVLPRGTARFSIKREIAETLQGRIYAGIDLITNKPVVIKEAWRPLVNSRRSRKGHKVAEDFIKERDLLLSLSKLGDCVQGLVKGIDKWDDERCHYYAMELCESELFDYIQKIHTQTDYHKASTKPQIPMHSPNVWVHNVTTIFYQICNTIKWLHSKGYCHLDLSLENVMISDARNFKVKIIDFGVAQKFNNNHFEYQGRIGKIGYMCPEAYSQQVFNAKAADVWSLGVMLFMMLIGAPPYQCPQPKNAAFNLIVNGRLKDVLKHWKRLRVVTEDALDLMDKMFKYQQKRISLEEVLRHSFFDEVRDVVLGERVDNTCDAILTKWGLKEISQTLHNAGWSDPSDWGQLTLSVLKFEIGLTPQQARLFVDKYKMHYEAHTQHIEHKEKEREDMKDERVKPKGVTEENVNIKASNESINNERIEIVNALEEVLDHEMDNLVTAYCQFRDFKQQFLSDNDNGIISCPNNGDANGNYNNVSGNNDNGKSPPNGDNNDSNKNEEDNGDNDEEDDDDDSGSDDYKIECNHLNECNDCSHILTQKSEQIKLFKSLVVTLQKQHEYHTSFENMLCKAIHDSGNDKVRKKAKTRKALHEMTAMNKASYNPIYRAKRNVFISRNLTQDIIPKTVKESISKVYSYLDRSIGLQYNDGQLLDEDDNKDNYKVLNFDFHDKTSFKSLYCVMEKLPLNKKSFYKWKMKDKLYRASELPSMSLPESSRALLMSHINDIYQYRFSERSIKDMMKKHKWNEVSVFNRAHNAKRITLSITKEQLNPLITAALLKNKKLIPILMFCNGLHWIEYVLIVRIQMDIHIGVSFKFNVENGVSITGIHLDKDMIYEQHELISPHDCQCLDGFTTIIHDICVGNPDDLANKVKDYKQRYHAFKQLIYKFVNGKDTEKYEILQQHAQMFIKHDNGSLPSLGGYSFMTNSTTRSISTCSSPPSSSSSSLANNPVLNEYRSESFSNDWTFIH